MTTSIGPGKNIKVTNPKIGMCELSSFGDVNMQLDLTVPQCGKHKKLNALLTRPVKYSYLFF